MKRFLKFMEMAAMPIGVIPWALLYIQGSKLFHYEINGGLALALLVFQFIGMFFQIGFAVQAYRKYRVLKKQVESRR